MGAKKAGVPMARFIFASVFIFAVLLQFQSRSYAFTVNKILASVDDEVITLLDYQWYLKSLGAPISPDVVDEGVLKKMMEEKVLVHEAKRKGIEIGDPEIDRMIEGLKKDNSMSQEEMEKQIKREGMDMGSYRKLLKERLMVLKLIETEVDSKVIVTDKEVKDFYEANRGKYMTGTDRVDLEAIFLRLNDDATVTEITDLKRKALKISAQLEQGESFELLVDRNDDDDLRNKGGRLGEFGRGDLIPQLENKVFSMKRGEISGPLWVKNGVYILKLINRTERSVKPLEQVRADIEKQLRQQRREKIFNGWMKSLWEKASIKIN